MPGVGRGSFPRGRTGPGAVTAVLAHASSPTVAPPRTREGQEGWPSGGGQRGRSPPTTGSEGRWAPSPGRWPEQLLAATRSVGVAPAPWREWDEVAPWGGHHEDGAWVRDSGPGAPCHRRRSRQRPSREGQEAEPSGGVSVPRVRRTACGTADRRDRRKPGPGGPLADREGLDRRGAEPPTTGSEGAVVPVAGPAAGAPARSHAVGRCGSRASAGVGRGSSLGPATEARGLEMRRGAWRWRRDVPAPSPWALTLVCGAEDSAPEPVSASQAPHRRSKASTQRTVRVSRPPPRDGARVAHPGGWLNACLDGTGKRCPVRWPAMMELASWLRVQRA